MKKYKSKFKESTERVPYQIYGNGNLKYFTEYFLNLYNKLYKTNYNFNNVDIKFKESSLNYPVNQIFAGEVKKYFDIEIIDSKTYNYIYSGSLLVLTDYRNKKINSYVTWDAIEKSPIGKKEQISFIFDR